jgi:hypothetical protein
MLRGQQISFGGKAIPPAKKISDNPGCSGDCEIFRVAGPIRIADHRRGVRKAPGANKHTEKNGGESEYVTSEISSLHFILTTFAASLQSDIQ